MRHSTAQRRGRSLTEAADYARFEEKRIAAIDAPMPNAREISNSKKEESGMDFMI